MKTFNELQVGDLLYIYYIFSDEDEFLEEVNKHNKDV